MVEINPNKSVLTINVNGLHITVKIQKDLTLRGENPVIAKTLTRNNDCHCIKGAIHRENVVIPHFMYLVNRASKYIMGKN